MSSSGEKEVKTSLKSPYPWFGGKCRVASTVWAAFGQVKNYVEPFFGSGAVLLARPDFSADASLIETINDADSFVCNFWRSVKADADAVAEWADYPVIESDLHARHGWLINRKERLKWCLEDPDFYDAKIAGWWVWGLCCWIGSGWCSGKGPWISNGAHIVNSKGTGQGTWQQLPNLGNAGRGINRKRPHLGDACMGINRTDNQSTMSDYIHALAERMRNVRVCCGDWSRVMGPSVTTTHGLTAVFLDPPYSHDVGRHDSLYSEESATVAKDVLVWCRENGDNPMLRIALCGYEGEHDLPGWEVFEWRALGGYGSQGDKRGKENKKRERIWFSPACHKVNGANRKNFLDDENTHE